MASPWDQFAVAEPAQPAGVTAPPGFDLVPLTGADPKKAGEQEGQDLRNEGQSYENQSKPVFDRANALGKVRDDYRQDKRVLGYEAAIPVYISALQSPGNVAGDNLLVNAFAKTLDPMTGVNQREGEAIEGGQPALDQLKSQLLRQFGTDGYGNFTPVARQKLREAVTVRMRQLADQYRLARKEHIAYIQSLGLPDANPETVIGPFAGEPFQRAEADYLGHEPTLNYVEGPNGQPLDPRTRKPFDPNGEGDIGFNQDQSPTSDPMSPQQVAAYNAFLANNPNVTPENLVAFGKSIGVGNIDNAQAIIDAYRKTGQFQPGDRATFAKPDISDVRGKDGVSDPYNAAVRGIADTATFGGVDKLVALTDTVFKGGTFDENLRRQYAISDFDKDQHGGSRLAGQLFGGFLIPFGYEDTAMSAARTALTEAKAAGATIDAAKEAARIAAGTAVRNKMIKDGAIIGGGYGAGSSRSLEEVPGNAIMGAVEGAAGGAALGEAGRRLAARGGNAEIPPLVDPVTGALNEPLEAAGPAGRVAAAKGFGIDLPMGAAGDRTAAILEKGFDISPPSAGLMNDARRVTEGQVSSAADDVASRFGTARTMNEGGGAAQRGANEWMGRLGALTTKLYNAIPIAPQAKATVSNTGSKLAEMTSRFASNPKLADMVNSPKLAQFKQAIDDHGLSWQDLKGFRSWVGEKIGERRFSEDDATSDFRALYGALSEDMRATAAANGPKALKAFERANDVFAKGQQRIEDALVTVLGDNAKNNPEAAMAAIHRLTRSGKGSADLKKLDAIRRSTIKSGEWDQVSSTLLRLMGKPAQSEGRNFDPGVFVRNYADMTEPARNLMFGGKKELRQALDDFVAVNQRLANSNALRNTSNTVPGITAAGTIGGISAAATNPLLGLKLAAGAAVNYGLAKLWTNPGFVQWATGYSKMLAGAARAGAEPELAGLKTHSRLLSNLAKSQPAIAQELMDVREALALPSSSDPTR